MKKESVESEGNLMQLSSRELDVLTLVACGFVDKEIARKLKIASKTVESHMKNILLKLDSRTRTQAAIRYYQFNPNWQIRGR